MFFSVIQVDDRDGVTELFEGELVKCLAYAEARKIELEGYEREHFENCRIQGHEPDRDPEIIKIVRLRTAKDLEIECKDLELGTTLISIMPTYELDLYEESN